MFACVLVLAGLAWGSYAWQNRGPLEPAQAARPLGEIVPGSVASMDSPAISYSRGWRVSGTGADPHEPADPWSEPAGDLAFTFTGDELALNLAVGDYWAYLYITVDGQPANLLPYVRGNKDSTAAPAGYRTFYEPDKQTGEGSAAEWVRVDHGRRSSSTHEARVEIWRGWDQVPVRGIAVDALPDSPSPLWPAVALSLLGLAMLVPHALEVAGQSRNWTAATQARKRMAWLYLPRLQERTRLLLAGACFVVAALGIGLSAWPLAVGGLAGLAVLSVARPALWTSALLFSLPFYFSYAVPVLPSRDLGLIDTFLLIGAAIAFAHWFLAPPAQTADRSPRRRHRIVAISLAIIVGWSLVAAFAAERVDVALHEWRTVFLAAGLFAILLTSSLTSPHSSRADLWLIVAAWLAGGMTVACAGIVQYASGSMLITAEGVQRIRAFYGSPNNLALYLERTFLVSLALAAFLPAGRARVASALVAAIQAVALALTFSKGALLLGVPAGLLVLWLGGFVLLPVQGRSRRPLLWLAAAGLAIAVILLPFVRTERFRGLFDFSQGTGYLRLLLWRSSWQMALDHLSFGVGPDNFLYAYRSAYILPEAWQEPNLNHPHNWILDWWTRLGLLGLAGALALFAVGFAGLWQAARGAAASQLPEAALCLGFLAAGIAALTHGLIDASFALPDLMIVWVLLLMAIAVAPAHNSMPYRYELAE